MTLQIGIYNHSSGEQTTREMTKSEAAEFAKGAIVQSSREAAETKAKEDKLAILLGLGISQEQAIILGLVAQEPIKRD